MEQISASKMQNIFLIRLMFTPMLIGYLGVGVGVGIQIAHCRENFWAASISG